MPQKRKTEASEKFKKLCILYILFLLIGWYNQAETWGGIAFVKYARQSCKEVKHGDY